MTDLMEESAQKSVKIRSRGLAKKKGCAKIRLKTHDIDKNSYDPAMDKLHIEIYKNTTEAAKQGYFVKDKFVLLNPTTTEKMKEKSVSFFRLSRHLFH